MKVSAAVLGLAAAVSAQNVTTIVTTAYTTYCPAATTFAYHNKTYTVTSATTLTILDCPCTLQVSLPPVYTTVVPCTTGTPYSNGTGTGVVIPPPASTTITVTPPVTTYLPVTPCPSSTPVGGGSGGSGGSPGTSAVATNTPVTPPKPSNSAVVTVNAAAHAGAGVGVAAAIAGLAAALL